MVASGVLAVVFVAFSTSCREYPPFRRIATYAKPVRNVAPQTLSMRREGLRVRDRTMTESRRDADPRMAQAVRSSVPSPKERFR